MKRVILLTGILTLFAAIAASAGEAPADAEPILVTGSPWRWHVTLRKPTVPVAAMKAAGFEADAPVVLPIKKLHGGRRTPDIQHLESGPPPAGWTAPDFDGTDWPRARGPFFRETDLSYGLICLRGTFRVEDQGKAKSLYLAMKFRGGAVVYLNGRELARSHLPEGDLEAATPGQAYPDEAFVNAEGKMLHLEAKAQGDEAARVAKRDRSLGPLEIPASALRKGVNVLAVELHRSDYHPTALGWWVSKNLHYGLTKSWAPVGLKEISISVAGGGGGGVEANIVRPQGVQVWNADLHGRIYKATRGDPGAELRPVRLAGARNGRFSGLVVVSSAAAIKGLKAVCSELVTEKGAKIPASAVRVRYVVEGNINHQSPHGDKTMVFNVPVDAPPAEVPAKIIESDWRKQKVRKELGLPAEVPGAIEPVMVTVRVPDDAAAGSYRGTLTISAAGLEATEVPVHMEVVGWKVPDPLEFRTRVGCFQSPTTLALHYKVPLWSEEHWKLMDKSFEMLAGFGNDLVNVPLSERTQFGNDEGMVFWIRKADGSYEHDFTVFDRYLKLVRKHLGRPRHVALHLWHPGTWHNRAPDAENTVTVIDEKTGKREHMQVPLFGTEEAKKFWKPVLDAIKKRLAAEGMEDSMCLGVLCDATAPPEVFKMFNEIAPGAGWTRGCHSTTFAKEPYAVKGGGTCVYHEFCYGLGLADPAKKPPRIWEMTGPGTAWFRGEIPTAWPVPLRRETENSPTSSRTPKRFAPARRM